MRLVRKNVTVEAQVITPELLEKLTAEAPGLVKRASVGDYLITDGEDMYLCTPEQLGRLYEPEGPTLAQIAEQLAEVIARLERVEASGAKDLAERIGKLEMRGRFASDADTRPDTPKAKAGK